jgi:hypothetical protein
MAQSTPLSVLYLGVKRSRVQIPAARLCGQDERRQRRTFLVAAVTDWSHPVLPDTENRQLGAVVQASSDRPAASAEAVSSAAARASSVVTWL